MLGGPQPTETYCKGEYKGLLFAKFASHRDRNAAVGKLRQAREQQGDNKVWAKADAPLEQRVAESFLFGVKKTFVDWGCKRGKVWVDTSALTLKVGGELAVTVRVTEKPTFSGALGKKS